jgi:hypothetical protein
MFRIVNLAVLKIIIEEDDFLIPKNRGETFRVCLSTRNIWGGVTRYAANLLIPALSSDH